MGRESGEREPIDGYSVPIGIAVATSDEHAIDKDR
jgi:hypothetical protein